MFIKIIKSCRINQHNLESIRVHPLKFDLLFRNTRVYKYTNNLVHFLERFFFHLVCFLDVFTWIISWNLPLIRIGIRHPSVSVKFMFLVELTRSSISVFSVIFDAVADAVDVDAAFAFPVLVTFVGITTGCDDLLY